MILRVRDNDGNVKEIPAIVGPAGSSIVDIKRTAGDGSPGSTDTYTVTLSDGKSYTYDVYNGKDGDSAPVPFVINTHFTFSNGSIVGWRDPEFTMAEINAAYDSGLQLILCASRDHSQTIQYYHIPLSSGAVEVGEDYLPERFYTFECEDFAVRIVPEDAADLGGASAIEVIRGAATKQYVDATIETAIGAAIGGSY